MTIITTPSEQPTTAQLIEALRTSEPNAARDLGIHLLESGKVRADSTLAELGNVMREHQASQQ